MELNMRRGFLLIALLFVTLTGLALALAQETTPDPAWPTETPTLIPTPSETPTPTLTLVPTGTNTPIPTPTGTASLVPPPVLELPTEEVLPFDDGFLLEVTEDVGSATPSETPTLTLTPSSTESATPTPTPTAFYYLGPIMTHSGAVNRDGFWYVFGIPPWLNTLNAQAVGIIAVDRSLSWSTEWKVMTILDGTPGISLFSDNPDNVPPVGGRMIPEAVPMVLTAYPGANAAGWSAMLAGPGTPSGVRFEFWPTPANPGQEWVKYRWVLRGWPTPTPSPMMTAAPTMEPTWTPTPSSPPPPPEWLTDDGVRIDPGQPIPGLLPYEPCDSVQRNNNDETSQLLCAVFAYNRYRDNLGGNMTWGQFVALVMYAEGHPLLVGQQVSGSVVYGNPQTSELGVCWRLIGTETWLQGADQCNVASSSAPGVQNDFTYAVWEWLFNECAKATGYVDYRKDGNIYNGECNETGFVTFLSQVNTLYIDTQFKNNPNLYLHRSVEEFAQWGYHDGARQRYTYGICPCTWGNVPYGAREDVPVGIDPNYESASRNDGRSYNNGWSFSYFAWEEAHAPDPSNRYFKVY